MAALEILRAVRVGAFADLALDDAAARLNSRDRAWTQELVYGTLRLRSRLDHHIAAHSRRPLDRLDADILDILRLGAYQLLEMGGVAPYAAVSQSVELAKGSAARGAAGFVSGVLQYLRRSGGASTFPAFTDDPLTHLCTWGSHPRWLVARWIAHFGADAARRLSEHNNTRPELFLRALADAGVVRQQLRAAGVETDPVDRVPQALRVVSGSAAAALAAAPVIVQDPAAGLVAAAAAAAVPAGARIIDVAAAPGGKTLALSLAARAPRFVVAADVSWSRLQRLRDNVARLRRDEPVGRGDVPVSLVVADARMSPVRSRSAGIVLLDAPCSGTGTLRRHPDGRWRLTPHDIMKLQTLQMQLLDEAAALVAVDGALVYATCSLEPEENELQVRTFLERQPDFELEPIRDVARVFTVAGMLRVTPHDHGFDGAFAAQLRRRA